MKKWIKKNNELVLAVLFIAILLVYLSGCSTTSVITTYEDGKIVKIEKLENGAIDKIVSSVKDKTLIIWKSGWAAYISASPATIQDPTPTLKIFAGKMDEGYISVNKDVDWKGISEAIKATNKTLNASVTGIKEER